MHFRTAPGARNNLPIALPQGAADRGVAGLFHEDALRAPAARLATKPRRPPEPPRLWAARGPKAMLLTKT